MPATRFNIEGISSQLETGTLILTPNHRISTAILDSYAAQISTNSWKTPSVIAIDIWIKQQWRLLANQGVTPCCECQVLENTEELLVWSAVIEQSLHKHPLLNPDETASLASRAYQVLRQWSLDESACNLNHYLGIPDVAVFAHWQKKFQQQCADNQFIALVDATKILIQLFDSGEIRLPEQLVMVNFYQPPLLYQALFTTLQKCTELSFFHGDSFKHRKTQIRYEFPDAQSEINNCANWIKTIIREQPNCHIGIISNQDSIANAELERRYTDLQSPESLIELSGETQAIGSQLLINSATDQKLADTGFINDAFLILNLNAEQQNSEEVCRLLQSPFLLDHEEEIEARLQMELFMRRHMNTHCSGVDLSKLMNKEQKPYFSPKLARALLQSRTAFRAAKEASTTREWAKLFQQQLTLFGWPGKSLTTQENSQLREWRLVLEQFSDASRILGKIRFSTALAKLRTLCMGKSEGKVYDSSSQVSICSPSEATGLNFSHIYFLACDDQSWPGPARPSPFLPHALQRELKLPHSNGELQYQLSCEQFTILCNSTSDCIVASHYSSDGDQELRASSLILDFPVSAADEEVTHTQVHSINNYGAAVITVNGSNANAMLSTSDNQALALKDSETPTGGHSIITNQSNCPFKAFATHRLHAEPLREFENGLNSMARGIAVHTALEALFSKISSGEQLRGLSDQQKQDLLKDSTTQAIEYLSSRHAEVMTPRFKAIEQQRIQNLLQAFLEKEIERPDFTVIAREQKQHWQLPAEGDAVGLRLNLQIDRIDQLEDGSLALIDYKTGKRSYSNRDWLQERPEDMQLPVYYCASSASEDADISAISIAHVNVEKVAYSGISRGDGFHASLKPFNHDGKLDTDWQQLTSGWQQKVNSLATEFANGVAKVDPTDINKSCLYCDLKSLCRIRELSSTAAHSYDGEDILDVSQ